MKQEHLTHISNLYRMYDKHPCGMFEIKQSEAKYWNNKGFGIFWAVNQFNGARKKENIVKVRALICDLDEGTNQEQLKTIAKSPLIPSLLIKTKRGYHLYWFVKDYALECHFEQQNAIINFLGGDKGAKDLCRVLRVPGYYHHKQEPFLVHEVARTNKIYSTKDFDVFPKVEKKQFVSTTTNGNHKEILQKLSGTHYVKGEVFEFSSFSNKDQIYINGKLSPCWLDSRGIIGSNTGHGGSIYNFLAYYGWSKEEIKNILRNL